MSDKSSSRAGCTVAPFANFVYALVVVEVVAFTTLVKVEAS